ncbi:MAG: prolipoprotein diacylglyceryl transferase [Magnetococcales bacterium]|nr:prolipoprotein diacylglyceryl transferase [Magnetococcales bacterium]
MGCMIWNPEPLLDLGFMTLRWYGLLFGGGILLGFPLLAWQFRRAGYPEKTPVFLAWCMALGMLIGAWLGHRLFYEGQRLWRDPTALFTLDGPLTGLSSHGATVGILAAAWLFARCSGIRFLELGDRMVFAVALVASSVRLGNLMNSEIVGTRTDRPWGVCFVRYDGVSDLARHPVQLYEAAMTLALLGMLVLLDRWAGGERRPPGLLMGGFGVGYFGGRFALEFFKERMGIDHELPLSMGQMLSIPFVLIGLWLVVRAFRSRSAGP